MKAILLKKYGSIMDMFLTDMTTPVPNSDEVRVKLKYTSINAADLDYIHGHPLVRFTGIFKPGYPILGSDLVGVVDAVGSNVSTFKVGDTVWADTSNPLKYGTFAEYTSVPAKDLVKLSDGINLTDAACLPSAGVVAYQNIKLAQPFKAGETALVNGAGGGIGNIIVQLLHSFGVEVTAVDNRSKHEILKSIGASHMIDYETTDFTKQNKQYDYVYDLVCSGDLKSAVHTAKENGHFIMVGGTTRNILYVLTTSSILSKLWHRRISLGIYETNNHQDLEKLETYLKDGTIKPVIDRIIPLSETIEGLKSLEEGNVVGKIVVQFNQ